MEPWDCPSSNGCLLHQPLAKVNLSTFQLNIILQNNNCGLTRYLGCCLNKTIGIAAYQKYILANQSQYRVMEPNYWGSKPDFTIY